MLNPFLSGWKVSCQMKIVNKTKDIVIVENAKIARSFFARLLGLMFRKSIAPDEALIFYHAPSIHMFFMRFVIDVVFLDKNMRVIKIVKNLKPWRITNCFGAYATIELSANTISQVFLSSGDEIEFI